MPVRYTFGGDEHLFVECSDEMSLDAFFKSLSMATGDQSVASTHPPASAAAMLGSPSPQPSSSTRAPLSARPAIARARATPLGHSSAQ